MVTLLKSISFEMYRKTLCLIQKNIILNTTCIFFNYLSLVLVRSNIIPIYFGLSFPVLLRKSDFGLFDVLFQDQILPKIPRNRRASSRWSFKYAQGLSSRLILEKSATFSAMGASAKSSYCRVKFRRRLNWVKQPVPPRSI